ncbi:MAG: hypothetical protein IIZ25_13080 [Thermoguttaceae bacterium]|nr:hypothetical protein [Thermoguttaceae bacterium]
MKSFAQLASLCSLLTLCLVVGCQQKPVTTTVDDETTPVAEQNAEQAEEIINLEEAFSAPAADDASGAMTTGDAPIMIQGTTGDAPVTIQGTTGDVGFSVEMTTGDAPTEPVTIDIQEDDTNKVSAAFFF